MTEQKTEIVHISTPKAHYTLDLSSGTIRAKPIITRADRIRGMTDEELAEFIASGFPKDACKDRCGGDEGFQCSECVLDWLKAEAEEAEP